MSRLFPITLTSPGRRGLNKERANDLLSSEWAMDALNCVLSQDGRLGARKGYTNQTTNAIADTPPINVLFEYLQADGTTFMLTAADKKIFKDIDDYTDSDNDITPSTTPSGNNWQFVNFNSKVVGFQQGHQPIVWDGTGDFADISEASGTSAPTGNAACAAFGRIWAFDEDGQTIQYCALLDETEWADQGGGGAIDLRNVWTRGMDRGIAIAAFGNGLVVFGRNHIIIYADSQGSELGIDPDNLVVVDTIEGTGTISRDSVQPIGEGDLAFLSRHGIQLLGRVIQFKSNPITTVSRNIRTYLAGLLSLQAADDIRSTYNPELGLYLLLLPTANRIVVADMSALFQDEDGEVVAPMLEWAFTTMPTAICTRENGDLLFGLEGVVGEYEGNLDGEDTYEVLYSSPWLLLDPTIADALKILKEIPTIVQLSASASIAWQWEFDFAGQIFSETVSHVLAGRSEWGDAEFNVGEFSGGLTLRTKSVDGRGEGQFIRVGFRTAINGFDLVLQQIKLLFKLGRMAA